MCGESGDKAEQHAAVRIVDGVFEWRARAARQPRRIADDELRAALGKEIRFNDFHLAEEAKAGDVLARTGECTRVLFGGDGLHDAALGEYCGDDTGAGTDIEGQRRCGRGQRRGDHQFDVVIAHRRKHAVVRMYASGQGRNVHAFFAPFMGTDQTEQFAQRSHRGGCFRIGCAIGFTAGQPHVGCARQRHAVVCVERNQQHAQHARALRTGLTIQMKGLRKRHRWRHHRRTAAGDACRARLAIGARGQCVQQLARVVEVAAPQQRGAFAGMVIGGVGRHAIVGDDDLLVRRRAAFRTPACRTGGAGFVPVQDGMCVHGVLVHSCCQPAWPSWRRVAMLRS